MSDARPPTQRIPRAAEALLKAKVIDEFQMKSALAQVQQWGHRLTRVVNDMRLAPEAKVAEALAQFSRLQLVDLKVIPGDPAALKKLEAAYCTEKGVFPCALQDHGKTLVLAMCDPTDMPTQLDVEQKTRCRLKLMVTSEGALAVAIARLYGGARPGTVGLAAHNQDLSEGIELAPATTGEFTDHKGDVVGNMRNEARGPPMTTRAVPPPPPVAVPNFSTPTADQLDGLFDFMPEALTPEEKQRLEAVKANQHRGSLILRAVLELCVEKGLLTADDVNKLQL